MAGRGAQKVQAPGGDGRQELLQALSPSEGLGKLGEVLELADALPRFLVEPRVLDRPGDERSARCEHLHFGVGELPRRLRMEGDDADHAAVARDDRYREE
jgi:hypothetical protein